MAGKPLSESPGARLRQVLVSNGQQTLGVALPWDIAANLAHPGRPIISASGGRVNITYASQIAPTLYEGLASPVQISNCIPVGDSESNPFMEHVHESALNYP